MLRLWGIAAAKYTKRLISARTSDGTAEKEEIAQSVFDIRLPDPESVRWTIGRLVLWSNDLLRDLAGEGFVDMAHAASFLWWAKDHSRLT